MERDRVVEFDDRDIIGGALPGGTNTSHTIAVGHLTALLAAVPTGAQRADYESAAVEQNVLGRATYEGRRRTFRYLRELYILERRSVLFRGLRDLWDEDLEARAQLAGLAALARDSAFRATSHKLLRLPPGAGATSEMLAGFVTEVFPSTYNADTAAKIGRNTASSWTQTGHLVGRTTKTRAAVGAKPVSMAYAVFLGSLQGIRGQALYDTTWIRFLDATRREAELVAERASQRGYLELRSAGGVVEIGFRHLMRPMEGQDA